MSSAGHVFEMIARLKFNESLKRKKKGYFTIAKEYRNTLTNKKLTYQACTEADRKEIRDAVRAYHRDVFIKRLMALGITVFILLMLITFWLLAGSCQRKSPAIDQCPDRVEVIKTVISSCDDYSNPYRMQNRIIYLEQKNDTVILRIGFAENCAFGRHHCIRYKDGQLLIMINRLHPDDGVTACNCCYEIEYTLAGIHDTSFAVIMYGSPIELTHEKYHTREESFIIENSDTINRTNRYGLKTGIWRDYHPNGNLKIETLYFEPDYDQWGNIELSIKEYDNNGRLIRHDYYDTVGADISGGRVEDMLYELEYIEKRY